VKWPFGRRRLAISAPSPIPPAVRIFSYHGSPKVLLDPGQLDEDQMVQLMTTFSNDETLREKR
jgi:hypothetical protein